MINCHCCFRIPQDSPGLRDYFELEKNYCPSLNDNICKRFRHELKRKEIVCDNEKAARIKSYLMSKCEKETQKRKSGQTRIIIHGIDNEVGRKLSKKLLNPEDSFLPDHIRPESYEVWLWIKKEPAVVVGNVTINVIVTR